MSDGVRVGAERRDEIALLAQMALDHRAMCALRDVLKREARGGGNGVEIRLRLTRIREGRAFGDGDGVFEVATLSGNLAAIGPDPETAFCAMARWPRG